MKSTLLVAGATGLVGSATVHAALRDDRISRVITWGRRPLAGTSGQVEFWGGPDPVAALRPEPVDAVICCLGTTIKAVKGDKQAFIHVDHISLVNIIAGKTVVPELIQGEAQANRMAVEVIDILSRKSRKLRMHEELSQIRDRLGEPGAAAKTAALAMSLLNA